MKEKGKRQCEKEESQNREDVKGLTAILGDMLVLSVCSSDQLRDGGWGDRHLNVGTHIRAGIVASYLEGKSRVGGASRILTRRLFRESTMTTLIKPSKWARWLAGVPHVASCPLLQMKVFLLVFV